MVCDVYLSALGAVCTQMNNLLELYTVWLVWDNFCLLYTEECVFM